MTGLKIKNHRLVGVPFVAANSYGGEMVPTLITAHDTAGRLDKGNCVSWFRSKECKTSAHVVIELDGSITQMVPFNRKAFHAGKSSWRGKLFVNGFGIGAEIVNPGALDKNGRAWFHHPNERGFPVSDIVHKATPEHGDAWWLPYTDAQIKSMKDLCRALCEEYAECNEIVTHWMISPGRKIDTNPLFPLEDVRAYAFGTDDGHEDEVPDKPPAEVISSTQAPPTTAAHSTEIQAASAGGLAGAGTLYQGTQNAVMRAAQNGSITPRSLLLALLSEPLFWAGLTSVLGSLYWLFKRHTRFKTEGK